MSAHSLIKHTLLPFVMLVASAGCSTGKGMGTVTGKVLLDGQPIPRAYLEFWPKDDLRLGSFGALTDEDGNFEIAVDKRFGTVKPGRFLVLITRRVANVKSVRPEFSAEILPPGLGVNVLPEIYNDKKRCPFVMDLREGGTDLGTLELTRGGQKKTRDSQEK